MFVYYVETITTRIVTRNNTVPKQESVETANGFWLRLLGFNSQSDANGTVSGPMKSNGAKLPGMVIANDNSQHTKSGFSIAEWANNRRHLSTI